MTSKPKGFAKIWREIKRPWKNTLTFIRHKNPGQVTTLSLSRIRMVEIELFSFCNRRCWFCPNSTIDRVSNNFFLDEQVYLKILEELESAHFHGVISYSRYNEPLSQRDLFLARIAQARSYVPNALLHSNTNGDYLNRSYLDQLYEHGLRSLNIQCYLEQDNPFDKSVIRQRIDLMSKKLELEYNISEDHETKYAVSYHYNDMKLLMYAVDFRITGNNRGSSLTTIPAIKRTVPCYIPHANIYIDYDGSVMPCCNLRSDVKKHQPFVLGNVNELPLSMIINTSKACLFRNTVLTNISRLSPCNECNFAKDFKIDLTQL